MLGEEGLEEGGVRGIGGEEVFEGLVEGGELFAGFFVFIGGDGALDEFFDVVGC